MPETAFRRSFVLEATAGDGRSWKLEPGDRTLVMGVLNLTPDSFFDGGRYLDPARAEARAWEMAATGADIIDIGGESTRPGSAEVSPAEQLRRVLPVLERAAGALGVPVSIDTSSAQVAREAWAAGAWMINDVTALSGDPGMAELAAETSAPVVLMHMRGCPATMQEKPTYADVVSEVAGYLKNRAEFALTSGVGKDKIIIDPGIGFGKTVEHNLLLLSGIPDLAKLGYPVLVGPSRKSFLGKITGRPAGERLWGTAGAAAAAVMGGAHIIRVHDPEPIRDVVAVMDALAEARG